MISSGRKTIAGLTFVRASRAGEWRRDRIRVFQPDADTKWVATAPGCSAAGNSEHEAVALLMARIKSAARSLRVTL